MKCLYDGKQATALDLCHGRHPVCDVHYGVGHQLEAVSPEPEPKTAEPKAAKVNAKR